jgi:aconitate hydratase
MPTNSSGARGRLEVGDASYEVLRLDRVDGSTRLLYSLKVLLENLLRCEDGTLVAAKQVAALASWAPAAQSGTAIGFTPTRVLLHDFTGCRAWSTWSRCATRWPPSAVTRRRSPR